MIRVGVVDSGIDGPARARVAAVADFPPGGRADPEPAGATAPRDGHGHGSRVGAIIACEPQVELLDARVFFDNLVTSAAQAAAAIDWLREREARLVNLSFGLREDRAVLREACARATAAGMLLVAAAPARGAPVYPAAYPCVLRATGDARCGAGQVSALDTAQADFGGHACWSDGTPAGASAGCAAVTAALAALWIASPGLDPAALRVALAARAAWHGPERRGAG